MNKIFLGIIKIVIVLLLFLLIFYTIFYNRFKVYIRQNWKKYKNNPFFLPLAGLFKPEGDNRNFIEYTNYNFNSWFWKLSKHFFSFLIKPIQYILNIITKIISSFQNTLDTFRYQAKIIRKMFADIVLSTAEKMSNSYSAVKFYQAKLNDSISRQKAIFQIIVYFTQAVLMTITGLINGPIISLVYFFPIFGVALLIIIAICIVCGLGIPFVSWVACPICALCFTEKTPIKLLSGKEKCIKHIRIGDILKKNNKVLSKLVFDIEYKNCDLYNYNGIIVTGSHLVIEDNIPIRIKNSRLSKKIYHNYKKLYCLITSKHNIYINDILFADFHECSDKIINQTNMLYMLDFINNTKTSYKTTIKKIKNMNNNNNYIPYYQWGFAGDVEVSMSDKKISIKDIQLGDILINNNIVYGVIVHSTENIDLYTININNTPIILSGTQIILWNNEWKRVYTIDSAVQVSKNTIPYIYNIITNNHTFYIDNLLVRDYLEINEDSVVFDNIHLFNRLSFS